MLMKYPSIAELMSSGSDHVKYVRINFVCLLDEVWETQTPCNVTGHMSLVVVQI